MAKAVVDDLEVVDIQMKNANLFAPAERHRDGLGKPILHQRPIWQAGQRIKECQELNSLFRQFSRGDIDKRSLEHLASALAIDDPETAERPTLRPIRQLK